MIRIVFAMMLVSVFIHAGVTTDVEITPGGTATGTETDDDIIWQQLPGTVTGHLLSSQYFIDYDQSCQVADDMKWDLDVCINDCKWWGGYFNCSGVPPFDPDFTIFIYGDDGEIPTPPFSGTQLAEFAIASGTTGETWDPASNCYYYETDIIDFPAETNTKYWIVYQASLEYETCGQWGIGTTDEGDVWEHYIYFASDVWFTGDAFDFWFWSDGVFIFGFEVDIAHELRGTVGIEQITWGGLKKLF